MGKIDIVYGFSKNINAEEAVREASVQIRSKAAISKIEFCLVFFNLPLDEAGKLSYNIKRILSPHTIVGFSFPLLIVEQELFKRGIIIIGFSGIEVTSGVFSQREDILGESEKLILRIERQAKSKRREFFLSFSELDFSSVLDFLKGIERGLGINFPFLGLLSCREHTRYGSTLLFNENVFNYGALGTLFFDNVDIFFEINSGFRPLGKGGSITTFYKNVVKAINHKPAVNFYKDYFGEKVIRSPDYFSRVTQRYPLGFRVEGCPEYIVAKPVKLNPDGSLILMKDVLSEEIKLMIPIRDTLISSLEKTAQTCKSRVRKPKIAIFFESFFRYKFLGVYYYRQLKILKDVLGDVPLVGGVSFYSMGLLNPLKIELGHFICENSFSFIFMGGKE